MGQTDSSFMKPLSDFSNILLHTGEYKSKNGTTEVTFSIENYYLDTMLILTKLRWKWTGWAVMCEILRQRNRVMKIQPYLAGVESLSSTDTKQQAIDKLKKNFNATAGPTDWSKSAPKGQTVLQCGGPNQNKPIKEDFLFFFQRDMKGDGGGSDTIVKFTPAMWVTPDVTAAFGAASAAGPGVKKDEILLHEMVHGMRQMAGTSRCAATPDNPGLDTVEEFMAIVISNMYRSEMGLTDLRADHRGFVALSPDLTNPQAFIDKDKDKATSNYRRLMQLKTEHPELCNNLKKVPAAFNPFKLI
jgi:hypothetical protein